MLMTEGRITAINEAMERLLTDRLDDAPLDAADFAADFLPLVQNINKLQSFLKQIKDFSLLLAQGNLDAAPPDRRNYLASSLKQLQAQLRHLTWQSQCVAQGDYRQIVDFMGDFAHAFNTMISQLRTRETDLAAQRDAMRSVFDNIEPIIIADANDLGVALYTNHKAKARFLIEDNDLASARARTPFLGMVLGVAVGQRHDLFDGDTRRWYTVVASSLPWMSGVPSVLFHCTDITAHKVREQDLSYAANTDELTGLSNRRAFDQSLQRAWQRCLVNQETLALFMVDIDYFKVVNDRYGHLHGDKCLQELAKVLISTVSRSGDVVARFGGEEFVVLLPATEKEDALRLAESMRCSVQGLKIIYDEDTSIATEITVSIGVTSAIPIDDLTPTRLLATADEALYQAKQGGRNRVVYQ